MKRLITQVVMLLLVASAAEAWPVPGGTKSWVLEQIGVSTSSVPATYVDAAGDAMSGNLSITNGRMGIGTTDPLAALHIVDTADWPNGILIVRDSSVTNAGTPRIGLVDTALGAVGVAPAWYVDNFLDEFRIFRSPTYTNFGTAYLTIDNSGNVSIAGTNETAKLYVEGNQRVAGTGTIDYVVGDGAGMSNVLSTFSVTQDYSLVSVVSTGLSLEVPTDLFLVKSFELFVPDTNATPTAHPINTHVWETSDYTGKPPYHGVSNNAFLVEGLVASNIAAASTNLWLVDGSSFAANNMVTILGLTNEYAQIRTLSGNVATLWRPTVYAHSMSCGVSRVLTGAGFVYQAQDSGSFHFSIDADAAVTANLRAILCGWRD